MLGLLSAGRRGVDPLFAYILFTNPEFTLWERDQVGIPIQTDLNELEKMSISELREKLVSVCCTTPNIKFQNGDRGLTTEEKKGMIMIVNCMLSSISHV